VAQPEIKTRAELISDAIRRMITYTTALTYFGDNSVGLAIAKAIGGATSGAYRLYPALLRRFGLLAAVEEYATVAAEERGARRRGGSRAGLYVVVRPHKARVTAITSGATDLLEVDDSTEFAATDSIRIRAADGTSETATIIAITSGTGPNAGDELEVATLSGSYAPSLTADDCTILLRHTIPEGSTLSSVAGVTFETVAALTVGDANPIFDGESTLLGLSDKVLCEATIRGSAGEIEPNTITGFTPAVPEIADVFNPERGFAGQDEETDYELKYRAAHGPARASMETGAWLEAICKDADMDVLRVFRGTSSLPRTMAVHVLTRSGGALSSGRKTALVAYLEQRIRSYLEIAAEDVTLTSVQVVADITLDPNTTLRSVWKAAAQEIVERIDMRTWEEGADVDEALLLSIIRDTEGVASLRTETFTPASDVVVADRSLPRLTQLTLTDLATGDTLNAALTVAY